MSNFAAEGAAQFVISWWQLLRWVHPLHPLLWLWRLRSGKYRDFVPLLGLKHPIAELIEKSTQTDELQSAEYLRLNPNARILTLVDGDFVLWESMAINLYLAQKYAGPMHRADPKILGLAANGIFWRCRRCGYD